MYNPYNAWQMPMQMAKKSIDWATILNNTQKTLGIINQAIPIVYQVKPLVTNAKTLFKIAGAINQDDEQQVNNNNQDYQTYQQETIRKDNSQPKFFL